MFPSVRGRRSECVFMLFLTLEGFSAVGGRGLLASTGLLLSSFFSSSILLLPVTKLTEHARADGARYVAESFGESHLWVAAFTSVHGGEGEFALSSA